MSYKNLTGKLERRNIMYFAAFPVASGSLQWEVLGVDNDDLSKELNPDVTRGKNVLGESTFRHLGYEPEISVDPWYADTDSKLYSGLKAAAIEEKYDDASIKGWFIEAAMLQAGEDGTADAGKLKGTGYKRRAYIVPQSTGGDTAGLGIPFTVDPVGPMETVTVVYTISGRIVEVT